MAVAGTSNAGAFIPGVYKYDYGEDDIRGCSWHGFSALRLLVNPATARDEERVGKLLAITVTSTIKFMITITMTITNYYSYPSIFIALLLLLLSLLLLLLLLLALLLLRLPRRGVHGKAEVLPGGGGRRHINGVVSNGVVPKSQICKLVAKPATDIFRIQGMAF